ncbi:hypothetical protein DRN74_06365, partial [Candidatus Micrarchaeota archaeon]
MGIVLKAFVPWFGGAPTDELQLHSHNVAKLASQVDKPQFVYLLKEWGRRPHGTANKSPQPTALSGCHLSGYTGPSVFTHSGPPVFA